MNEAGVAAGYEYGVHASYENANGTTGAAHGGNNL